MQQMQFDVYITRMFHSNLASFLFLLTIGQLVTSEVSLVPQVAFKCGGFVAHYKDMDTGRWVEDSLQRKFCFDKDPNSVRRYCNEVYGNRIGEVKTVSENRANELVSDFCEGKNTSSCFGQQFTCYVGKFVAKSLVVPQNCTFAHEMDKENVCQFTRSLQRKAEDLCANRLARETPSGIATGGKLRLRDFGLLSPCNDANMFRGIEFVCCPDEKQIKPAVVSTNPDSMCRLPPETGRCRGSFRRWFYDVSAKTCFQFVWGGCQGNENNFIDHDSCLAACGHLGGPTNYGNDVSTDEEADSDDVITGSGSGAPPPAARPQTPSPAQPPQGLEEQLREMLHNEYFSFDSSIPDPPFLSLGTDNVDPDSSNEHKLYKQAMSDLEDAYESQMSEIMHNYERAERKFVALTNATPKLAQSFRGQLRQVYQEGVNKLEVRYEQLRVSINHLHKARVTAREQEKRLASLGAVESLLDQRVLDEPALAAALTRYLHLEQGCMQGSLHHYQRLVSVSLTRAAAEYQGVMGEVYTSHDAGEALSTRVRNRPLSKKTTTLIEKATTEFSEFFDSILAEMDKVANEAWSREEAKASSPLFRDPILPELSDDFPTSHDASEWSTNGRVFAAKYVDNTPGLGKTREMSDGRELAVIVVFAGFLLLSILLAFALVGWRVQRRRRLGTGGPGGFARVDNPHGLSPDEKHMNSMQVNGYFNPTYKFFDGH